MEKLRKQLEREFGVINDKVWSMIQEVAGDINCPEDEEYFLASASDILRIVEASKQSGDTDKSSKVRGRKPGWTGNYSKSFDSRYDIYCFVKGERLQRSQAYCQFLGDDYVGEPTWQELYDLYKTSKNPRTGLSYDPIPGSVEAFEKTYRSAEKEYELSMEDSSNLTVQMYFDAVATMQNPDERKTLCDAYDVVRKSRQNIPPSWQGKINHLYVYDLMEAIIKSKAAESLSDTEAEQSEAVPEESQDG